MDSCKNCKDEQIMKNASNSTVEVVLKFKMITITLQAVICTVISVNKKKQNIIDIFQK